MKHITVFKDSTMYAGWPANHGAWQWGNEFLCGFMRGPHEKTGMHNIGHPYEKVQARSLDGGETWNVEIPNIDFNASLVTTMRDGDLVVNLPPKDFIYRFCGVYDTGGETCYQYGGFYASSNRGKRWSDPYELLGLDSVYHDDQICTSRTARLDDFFFFSVADKNFWGSDVTFCTKFDGHRFEVISQVCNDSYRAVMPAVTKIDSTIYCALRRRYAGQCWIDLFASEDNAQTWSYRSRVAETGGNNGNPPALMSVGNKLICAYADRGFRCMCYSISEDAGRTFKEYLIRQGEESDIGYPRLFKREDNKLVCVYYWSDKGEPQRIESTLFEV